MANGTDNAKASRLQRKIESIKANIATTETLIALNPYDRAYCIELQILRANLGKLISGQGLLGHFR